MPNPDKLLLKLKKKTSIDWVCRAWSSTPESPNHSKSFSNNGDFTKFSWIIIILDNHEKSEYPRKKKMKKQEQKREKGTYSAWASTDEWEGATSPKSKAKSEPSADTPSTGEGHLSTFPKKGLRFRRGWWLALKASTNQPSTWAKNQMGFKLLWVVRTGFM